MKNRLLILLLIASFYTTAQTSEELVCISLGESCSVAAALKSFNLRTSAYPFDWVISPYTALYKTLANDFVDSLNTDYFQLYVDSYGVMNRYGIIFVPDFLTIYYSENNKLNMLPEIEKKYQRRIKRFQQQCLEDAKIYFFRYGQINREEAINLRNLLHAKYPSLDFILVAITDSSEDFTGHWQADRIKNYAFNIRRDRSLLSLDKEVKEWQRIFSDLGILNNKRSLESRTQKYVAKMRKKVTHYRCMESKK